MAVGLVKNSLRKSVRTVALLLAAALLSLSWYDAGFAAPPDLEFTRSADRMDREMFDIFLETVGMIKGRELRGLSKYFDDAALAAKKGGEPVSIAGLAYPSRSFKIKPFDKEFAVTLPVEWKANPYDNVSWVLWFQNLSWLNDTMLKAEQGDEASALYAFRVIQDWIVSNTAWPVPERSFVYDDHGSAERVKMLNRALRVYERSSIRDDAFHDLLLASILNHIGFLASEEHYNWNNHGIMMDVALLEVLRDLPGFRLRKEVQDLAVQRITRQFAYSYTDEGVHKEHSVCYHVWVTAWLLDTIDLMEKSGLPVPENLSALVDKAGVYNTFIMTKPGARFSAIGDCSDDQQGIIPGRIGDKYYGSRPELEYSITGGARGKRPSETIKVFPLSGVAVFRDAWPPKVSATVQSSFHSNVHKHEDDTSFVLNAYGKGLIVDAGLHTYQNKPMDVYSWKARAHNVLLVDGRDFDFKVANAGLSGITRYRVDPEGGGGVVELTHPHYEHSGVSVFRQFGELPGGGFLVRDLYRSQAPHRYAQLFHLAPGARIASKGNGVLEVTWDGYDHVLWLKGEFDDYRVTEGGDDPVQGWYFPKFGEAVPEPVLELRKSGSTGDLTTYLCITAKGKTPDWKRLAKSGLRMISEIEELPRRKLEKEEIPKTLVPTRKTAGQSAPAAGKSPDGKGAAPKPS